MANVTATVPTTTTTVNNINMTTSAVSEPYSTAEPEPANFCDLANVPWYYYITCYLAVYLGGLLLTVLGVYVTRMTKSHRSEILGSNGCASRFALIQRFCEELMSGESLLGKVCMFLLFVFSILSWMRFVLSTYLSPGGVPYLLYCDSANDPISYIDFVFNIYFLIIFLVRFVASRERVKFWFTASTFVDCITIPNAIYNFVQSYDFIAFNFLRSVRLNSLADILMYLRVLKGYQAIRISQLLCLLLTVWLTGAGFVAVIENAGNFWQAGAPGNVQLNYFTAVYYILVTMSTIGYGDFTCQTILGRLFMCVFIGIAVGLFAAIIPELAKLLTRRGSETRRFRKYGGEQHIVVCGSLNYHSMKNFLRDIFNESRAEASRNCKVVFLINSDHLELKVKALAKKHSTIVDIFRGNPTNQKDLERVQLQSALAVLIMCNLNDPNPHEQDSTTVMRAIAIKDFCPDVRCIAQLIQYQYKVYLQNIPSWNPSVDGAVCITELKLALIAQNCIAPGFCTLLTNLITFAATKSRFKKNTWQDIYKFGADYEIYHVPFSDTFVNLLFSEAVELCFTRLNVMLIAIDIMDQDTSSTREILINPYDTVYIDPVRMCAFILAKSESEAKRVTHYCLACHTNRNLESITKCDCDKSYRQSKADKHGKRSGDVLAIKSNKNEKAVEIDPPTFANGRPAGSMHFDNHACSSDDEITRIPENAQAHFLPKSRYGLTSNSNAYVDSTGLFHWCPRRDIEEVLVDPTNMSEKVLAGHVVACVFVQSDTPTLGLVNFVMPLRSIFLSSEELKPIVFIGNLDYFVREWAMLQNFPQIYILPGSPLNRANLRAAYLANCSSCVIISSPHNANLLGEDQSGIDNDAVICTLTIKSMPNSGSAVSFDAQEDVIGDNLNIFTELIDEKNGVFLDVDDRYAASPEVFMLQGFACGRIFNVSILHSLMSNTFFSADTLRFVQALICGGITADLEQILAEENGLPPGKLARNQSEYFRSTFRLKQMTLRQPPLSDCIYDTNNESEPIYFRHLFLKALRHYGIICMGMYRKMDFSDSHAGCKRFVITFPSRDFVVDISDLVFCIEPIKNPDLPNIPLNN